MTDHARVGLWRLAVASLVLVSACKKDATTPDPNGGGGGGSGSISISLSASTLSLDQGKDGTVTATVGRSGGFTGAISVSVTGAPSGVTATASPSSVAAGSTASTIKVSVGGSAAAGSYSLTVKAGGSGVSDATAALSLTVSEVATGSFTISIDPTSLSVQTGADGTAAIAIARTNFTGAVSLVVTGAPSGVTATVDPASTTANTSALKVAVGGSAAAGGSTLTITGTAAGLPDRSVTLALTVTVPATGSGNTVWQFCPLSGVPVWFAYQDGSGPWTEVDPDADHKYAFDINSDRGGVAYTMTPTNQASTEILFGTQQELSLRASAICGGASTGKTVNGTVAGVGATDQVYVGLGGSSATVTGSGSHNFQLTRVPDGTRDLIAGRSTITFSGATASLDFTKGIIRRGLDPADGSTLPVLDFDAAEAFTPAEHNLTLANLGSDGAQVVSSFFTPNGAVGALYAETSLTTSATRKFKTVPASVAQSGDLNVLSVTAYPNPGTVPDKIRSAVQYFAAAADQTVTLGPDIGPVTVSTTSTTPYVMPRAQYTVQPEYDRFFTWVATQVNGATARTLLIMTSAGYLGGASALDLAMPDFTGVGNWDAAWALSSGVQATWTFAAAGWSTTGGDGTMLPYLDGAVSMTGSRIGQIVF